jgi:pyruvate dehydrogenase E1 component alpha subunit
VTEILIPAMGIAMEEALLVKWLKQPGDEVSADEAVAEIETDKASMELTSPVAGRLGPHRARAGEIIPVGTAITEVIEHGEDSTLGPAPDQDRRDHVEPPPAASGPISVGPSQGRRAARALSPRAQRLEREHHQAITSEDEVLVEIDLAGAPLDDLGEWLETMTVIREFEDALEPLTRSGKIPGDVHQATGQEAVAVGAIRALAPGDIVSSPHRPHHHALAKGLAPRAVMAELWGRTTGCAGGRGGTMHLNDFRLGYFGSNGIVGGALGIAMGAALAAKLQHTAQVCIGFFGEGGANTGRTWEFINFAAMQKLPLIAFCENNHYAVETYVGRSTSAESIADRAAGFGLPSVQVDGQDVCAVYRATSEAHERALGGEGPSFIEAVTYRYHGHQTSEVVNYRTDEELEHWRRTKDPIARLRRALEDAGRLPAGDFDKVVAKAREIVEDAIRFAESSPLPDPATAAEGVTGLVVEPRHPS